MSDSTETPSKLIPAKLEPGERVTPLALVRELLDNDELVDSATVEVRPGIRILTPVADQLTGWRGRIRFIVSCFIPVPITVIAEADLYRGVPGTKGAPGTAERNMGVIGVVRSRHRFWLFRGVATPSSSRAIGTRQSRTR